MAMGDTNRQEVDAFLAFVAAFSLSRPVAAVSDLSDGAAWFEILQLVDAQYFRAPSRQSTQPPDNWVLRSNSLKRLYRLMTQYSTEVLQYNMMSLEVPDLQALAKDYDATAALAVCRLAIAIAVQSENNQDVIHRIQSLSESHQHVLMQAIEKVMHNVSDAQMSYAEHEAGTADDDLFYQIQSERSKMGAEKETIGKAYAALIEEHRTLQASHDDVVAERDDFASRLQETRRELDDRRLERADVGMRAEIDRLRTDLQKSEDNLNVAELELEKNQATVVELQANLEDLRGITEEAAKLKDQVDEYRHAADKLQKTENVMEKYKKKLEESADLRRRIKALEEQNASLVDKNAALEEEYRKVSAFKPLMESYKTQIAEIEGKASTRSKEIESLRFDLEEARAKLKIAAEEREKDSEAIGLYQERVRELELLASARPLDQEVPRSNESTKEFTEAELLGTTEEAESRERGLGGELDDALSGNTMTDLKLQIRQLKRELEAKVSNQADASRMLVLENLLDDANKMKSRYEADYLAAHREKLILQRDIEEIRNGKSLGDGAEAAIALRQRLNETVDQLDDLQRKHAELEVNFEQQSRELTIAKSDLNLVNKDQLEILASLRESVNEDKAELQADMQKLQNTIKELTEKNNMQLEQINSLLFEKVSLQSEGIGQRERLLERERTFNNLKASLNGKDIPEDIKARLLSLHEDNLLLKEQLKTTSEKFNKAKAFIKSQDKLFKQEHARSNAASPNTSEDTDGFKAQLKVKEEELVKLTARLTELKENYSRERELMISAIHTIGMQRIREQANNRAAQGGQSSWLKHQRENRSQLVRRQ